MIFGVEKDSGLGDPSMHLSPQCRVNESDPVVRVQEECQSPVGDLALDSREKAQLFPWSSMESVSARNTNPWWQDFQSA